MPRIRTLRGRGCWDRHAARVWLHVLVSGRAASAGCQGDSACRLLRSLARTKCAVRTPAGCDGGAADRRTERAWLLG